MNKTFIKNFEKGICINADQYLGAHFDGKGTKFTVYAPCAKEVRLIGSFNNWDPDACGMERDGDYWTVYLENAKEWDTYKYRILDRNGAWRDKADPYAFYSETRPQTASKIADLSKIAWSDGRWMKKRSLNFDRPMSIYEVYAGGWKKNGEFDYSYDMLREELIPYVKEHGFTHIEFMPLNEYPFDGSWGYQASGYYALTSRYGNPIEFARFVDECHKNNIGVIMDMVPVHFVKDEFGLRMFDGSSLYEYPNRHDAESEWGTMNFDLGKGTVRSFLISAAAFWLKTYHIDGIRMDAVSNLIFWGGNKNRGVNEGALEFIKQLNTVIKKHYKTVMMIAEDSSDYPGVTHKIKDGGLGFDYKWDLGWMNDTLRYFETDPLYRCYDHNKLTFSMAYFYSENFIMPFSHDENVHSKKTIVDRMWGDYDQKFAQARALYMYMFAHPGKKLNFMGNEFATFREFDEKKELDWFLMKYPRHDAFLKFFKDLNNIYTAHPSLYSRDYRLDGFRWIDADNAKQSVYSFQRFDEKETIVFIMNLTATSYSEFEIPVDQEGTYSLLLDSDDSAYDGSGFGVKKRCRTHKKENQNYICTSLPGFSALMYATRKKVTKKKAKDQHD